MTTQSKDHDDLGALKPFVDALRRSPVQTQIHTAQQKLMERLAKESSKTPWSLDWLRPWQWLPAAAAVLVVGVLSLLPGNQQLAFADVIKNLNRIESFRATIQILVNGETISTITSDYAEPGLVRLEMPGHTTSIFDVRKQTFLTLMHDAKTYMQVQVGRPGTVPSELASSEAFKWLDELKTFQGEADTMYPREFRNDQWVVGFGLDQGNTQLTLWADAENGLPVSLAIATNEYGEGIAVTEIIYEFNLEFDAAHFSLATPNDYTDVSNTGDF